MIEKYSYGNPYLMSRLTREMKLFHKVEDEFGRVFAIRDRNAMLPSIQITNKNFIFDY